MKKLTILVDVDAVVADTIQRWLDMYNDDYLDNVHVADIHTWSIHTYLKPECGYKFYDYLKRPDFYDLVYPIRDANWGVERLREFGHRVIFVSAGFYESKVKWLARYNFLTEFLYPNDRRPETAMDVVLVNDKSLIVGDVMIDDNLKNIAGLMNGTRGIVFDQPWNRYEPDIERAYNWRDVVNKLTTGDKS